MTRILPPFYDYPGARKTRLDSTLALANSDPLLIARGLVTGVSTVHKFGRNPDVANGSWEGILTAAAQFYWPQAALPVRVKAGGNAADDMTSSPMGAGAWTVTVQGVDGTGAEIMEDIELAGASASAETSQSFLRVYRAWVKTAGTYTGNNTGNVVIETNGGNTINQVTAGEGQTQYCAYTIPLGKTGYITALTVQADAGKSVDFRLFTRANCTDTTPPYQSKRLRFYWDGVLGVANYAPYTAIVALPALTDVWMEARGAAAGTEATANIEIILVDD